jgi:hypothetical protein
MKRLALIGLVVSTLAFASASQAKGPAAATIDGPGTGGGVSLGGGGEPGNGVLLGTFTQQAGLFPALFRPTPDPMLDSPPAGDLGPRYTVTYRLPGPSGTEDDIRQDLYPYAKGGPVTYTQAGQRFFETRTTRGGWYQASSALKDTLLKLGLPRTAPSGGSTRNGAGFTDFWLAIAAAFALGLIGLTAVVMRRRLRTAAT